MFELTYQEWKADKPLFWSSLSFVLLLGFLLLRSVYSFLTLRPVVGKITSVDIDVQKNTYLTLRLANNDKIFYQDYQKRFYDPEIQKLHKDELVTFFTFNSAEKIRPALSKLGDQSSFDYYPVFGVNKSTSLLQIIYYYFYNKLLLNLLLVISYVMILYNGFYIFVKANWLIKVPFFFLMLTFIWIIIP